MSSNYTKMLRPGGLDGTQQNQRTSPALSPDYARIDGRSSVDLIKFAQAFASGLAFYNESGTVTSDWDKFFDGDADVMAQFLENPKMFAKDKSVRDSFSRPQLVLFLAFVQLLTEMRGRIDSLTGRHLDFYYREFLGLAPLPPVADQLHAIIDLATNTSVYTLPAGTQLSAGKDSTGNQLTYTTDRPAYLNKGMIAELRSIFVDATRLGVKGTRLAHYEDKDQGFDAMMKVVYGDPLPEIPSDLSAYDGKAPFEQVFLALYSSDPSSALEYITKSLFLAPDDFTFVMETQGRQMNDLYTGDDWDTVYQTLDDAYRRLSVAERTRKLVAIYQSDSDLSTLLTAAYAELPPLPPGVSTVESLDPKLSVLDETYVTRDLGLSVEDFSQLSGKRSDNLSKLEHISRIRSQLSFASPGTDIWSNLYVAEDATKVIRPSFTEDDTQGWRTLGAPIEPGTETGKLGFGFASNVLLLGSGQRNVSLVVGFDPTNFDLETIQSALLTKPFLIELNSNGSDPVTPTVETISGAFLVHSAEAKTRSDVTLNSDGTTISNDSDLSSDDVGGCYVDTTGEVYRICEADISSGTATVEDCGTLQNSGYEAASDWVFYPPGAIYPCAIQFDFSLTSQDPAITAPDDEAPPYLSVLLADLGESRPHKDYTSFADLQIDRISLAVTVGDASAQTADTLEGVSRDLWIQNDDSPLQTGKTFYPWGSEAAGGARFYLAHPELCDKRLDSLTLGFDWVDAPADFSTTYTYYPQTITSNTDLLADLKLCDHGSVLIAAPRKSIFQTDYTESSDPSLNLNPPPIVTDNIPGTLSETYPNFDYRPESGTVPSDDFTTWERYWMLQLDAPGFQANDYYLAANTAAQSSDVAQPPYAPKASLFSVGYSSSTEWIAGQENDSAALHLHPFGWCEMSSSSFLPVYDLQGQLYVGVQDIELPTTLSLLFQMADDSGINHSAPPNISWSYLATNQWRTFPTGSILLDETNGLLQTGMVVLQIPEDATDQNTILPAGNFWLRVACDQAATGVSSTISILPQAVSATFLDQDNAADHYDQPLPTNSLVGLVQRDPAIRSVTQPYTSKGGAPAEDDSTFYTRAAERLRHKARAVMPWDYERIVLQHFPDVHTALCLPVGMGGQPGDGTVKMVVVPDVHGQVPFDPYRPQPSTNTLSRIESLLQPYSATGSVEAVGPEYLEVTVRIAVKLRDHVTDRDLARQHLNQTILEYLSPWAFEDDQPITFGGKIYCGDILALIDRQPYVDYCTEIKLFAFSAPELFRGVYAADTEVTADYVEAIAPGSILTSAPQHLIDFISDAPYESQTFSGIGYMRVGFDFKIG